MKRLVLSKILDRVIRILSISMLGLFFVAGTIGCGTAFDGADGESDQPGGNNPDPPATTSKYSLQPASSCQDIEDRLVDVMLKEILNERYLEPNPPVHAGERAAANDSSSSNKSGSSSQSPDDYTETNNQVEGVDEADIIKTDGNYIYAVREQELIIMKSWPADQTEIVSRYNIEKNLQGQSGGKDSNADARALFLKGDRVGVFSRIYDRSNSNPTGKRREDFYGTRISILDVSDRSNPKLEKQLDIEGRYTSGRMIDGDVYLVSNSEFPNETGPYGWDRHELLEDIENEIPDRADYDAPKSERKQLAREAKPIIRAELEDEFASRDIKDIFPQKRIFDSQGNLIKSESLYSCSDIYLPRDSAKLGLLNISHFDLDTKINIHSTGLMAKGWKIYASKQNLYVAMSNRFWWWGWGSRPDNKTHIHKFGFNGPNNRPEYKASGKVEGWLLNQFSMSEHNGYFRVATTDNRRVQRPGSNETEVEGGNHVFVLEQNGGKLEVVGSVKDLAPGERIYSVRFMGDEGYVVTFERIDPLFSLDLSDPTNPKVTGQLKVQGFSSYIHPIGDNHLLTIGQDANQNGRVQGVQLQIFDVTDPNNPTRDYKESISTGDWSSWSEAMWDHHAFTYHPEKKILAFPVNIDDWSQNNGEDFSGLLIYRASEQTGFEQIGRVNHADLVSQSNTHHWWTRLRRSIFIEDYVYSFSTVGLKVNKLLNPSNEIASVAF